MPGSSLKGDAVGVQSDDPVEDPHFFISVLGLSHPASDFNLEGILKLSFVPGELLGRAHTGEVVSMHHQREATAGVLETTWVSHPSDKPKIKQNL